ncbi:MAG: T9SS type A sorting domain-containing protein [Candidatus Eisenbacteria bacterium]
MAFAVLAGLSQASSGWGSTTYSLRILGTLNPGNAGLSYGFGINDAGTVVGSASNAAGTTDAFRWSLTDGMTDCGTLVVPYPTYGFGINGAGELSGYAMTQSNGFAEAFHQSPNGNLVVLPGLGGAGDWYAYAISEGGVMVGWSNTHNGCGSPLCASNPGRAITWSPGGVLSVLPDLGGYCAAATDISPDGSKICGYGANPAGQIRGFRLQSGVATELPPLSGFDESYAWGVTNAGQVVGYSALGSTYRATLWVANAPIDLGVTSGAAGSIAIRINESGVIVGYAVLAGPTYRALTFAAGSAPTDLNAALDHATGFTLSWCNEVNSSGQIVGGADSSGVARAFVLTPAGASEVEPSVATAGPELREPVPNPTELGAELRFSLANAGRVQLLVISVSGRVVARLLDAWMEAGEHAALWSGSDDQGRRMPAGVYLAKLTAESGVVTRKLIVRR